MKTTKRCICCALLFVGGVVEAAENSNAIGPASNGTALNEIIVTAEKKDERLQDVPMAVTALDADTLVESNQLRLEDYYASVPGLSLVSNGTPASAQVIAIRGITTGAGTNPTVGITIDDVPFGSATNLGGGNILPNIDPGELSRIEVLRGPQGTLYGASSLGGLIKYVTLDPSTNSTSGSIEAGTSGVHNGSGLGYNVRGSVNMPLSDTVAVRAGAFTREDPGYVDNVFTHVDGVNVEHDRGGRVGAMWKPSQDLSIKFGALYETFDGNGVNDVRLGLRGLQQNFERGTGAYSGSSQSYSLAVATKLGAIDLTSLSGYNVQQSVDSPDLSFAFGALALPLYGVSDVALLTNFRTSQFSQEIRLSSSIGSRFEWRLGGFYLHQGSMEVQTLPALDPNSGAVVANGFTGYTPSIYREFAAFADLTVHVTDKIDVRFGGRESDISQVFAAASTVEPLFLGGSTEPQLSSRAEATAKPFTYEITPSVKLLPDLMFYARGASGYRAGGPNNTQFCSLLSFPCQYAPDKTQDYELGVKGEFFDHTLSIDTSVYYINWKNMQLVVITPQSVSYNTNASASKSQGVELSIDLKPLKGMTINTWVTWDDAELTKAFPPGPNYGAPGGRLPYSSSFSGTFSLQQEFPLVNRVTGFVAGSMNYVGARPGDFTSSPALPPLSFPAYARTDLRGGVRYKGWSVILFINNLSDKRGSLSGNPATSDVVYIQPRTIGVNVAKIL